MADKRFGSVDKTLLEKEQVDRQKTGGGDGDKTQWLKIEEGKDNVFRILPPLEGQSLPYHTEYIHFKIFVDGKQSAIKCPKDKHGRCPICEEVESLYAIGTPQAKKRAWMLTAQPQHFYNVMTSEGEVGVLAVDKKCQKELDKLQQQTSSLQGNLAFDLWDVEKGEMVKIVKTKGDKGKRDFAPNVFNVGTTREVVPITEELAELVLEKMKDLTKLYKDYTYEELAKIYGTAVDGPSVNSESTAGLIAPAPATVASPAATEKPATSVLTDSKKKDVAAFLAKLKNKQPVKEA